MEKKLEKKLKNIIIDLLVVDPLSIVPDARFKEDLKIDDLSMVELIIEIEEEFKINITDEDTKNLFTVKDLITYLNKKIKK